MNRTAMEEILAAECGGDPSDYEATLQDVPSLDDAAEYGGDFDMSADDVPVEFEEVDLDEAEGVTSPTP